MRPLSLIAVKRERSWTRSGLALLAAFMLLACLYPSPARAQQSEQDRQKADRIAPPDWDAGLVDLLLPARRVKPAAALMNQGFIAPGSAFVNPGGAGTINNRASSLGLGTGSTIAPAQFSGSSNPPSTPDNWLGGPGNWSNASNWSNGLPSGTSDVFIDNGNPKNSPVTLDTHAAINNLTIDSDDSLNISNGNTLAVDGPTVANAGTIFLSASGSGASLFFNASSATLSGGGTVSMSNNSGNSIGANTLTNQETIQGSGSITVSSALNNSGTINANQSTPLVLSVNTATNTGTLEATTGGTLQISGGTYNNTGGIIGDDAGTLQITSATINGGTLTQLGAGNLHLEASTINAPVNNSATGTVEVSNGASTISGTLTNPAGGQVKIDNGGNLVITASTISNAGTIAMNSTGGATTLTIGAPNVTLTGGGSLTMSDSANNIITGSNPSNILTNQETISGAGSIGSGSMVLNNSGTVNANQTTSLTLQVSTSSASTNTGLFEATNGGTLVILGGTFANNGGTIQDGASTLLIEGGATINGGVIAQAGAGMIKLGGTTINAPVNNSSTGTIEVLGFSGVNTISGTLTNPSGGEVKIDNGGSLTITAPTISNAGTISMNASGSATTLTIGAPNVTLSGGGTLTMSDSATNIITGSSPANKLINQETIQGSGNIGEGFMALNNSGLGLIDANQTTALTLQISNGATNSGFIEATNGGTLIISGGTYTNTLGAIYDNASTILIQGGAIINGGSVYQTGAGHLVLGGGAPGTVINAAVTNSPTGTIEALGFVGANTITGKFTNPAGGQVIIDNGGILDFNGPVSNSGMMWMNSTGSTTELEIGAPKVTFSGKGILMMSNNSANLITGAMPTDMLFFQGTMEGGGTADNMGITNSGTILANNGTMTIFPSSKNFINTGKLTVTSGNTLSFIGPTSNAFTTSGTVNVNSGGNFTFQAGQAFYNQTKGTTTVDGKLTSPNGFNISGGTIYGNLGTLVGNLNLSGTGAVNPGDGIKKVGELTINGNFTIQSSTAISIFDLGGTSAGKFDVVNISKSASLGGKLTAGLVNSFKPVAGNSFDIMNYASESGMFSSETLPVITGDHWLVTIGATDVMLQLLSGSGPTEEVGGTSAQAVGSFFSQPAGGTDYAGGVGFIGNVPPSALPGSQFDDSSFSNSGVLPTQTPEPSSLLLLATGLMGVGAWRRRRIRKV
jgi:hypothetical protein